jgi:hypothetical protein
MKPVLNRYKSDNRKKGGIFDQLFEQLCMSLQGTSAKVPFFIVHLLMEQFHRKIVHTVMVILITKSLS